jgi:hypothetical protein
MKELLISRAAMTRQEVYMWRIGRYDRIVVFDIGDTGIPTARGYFTLSKMVNKRWAAMWYP